MVRNTHLRGTHPSSDSERWPRNTEFGIVAYYAVARVDTLSFAERFFWWKSCFLLDSSSDNSL
jgi:hypothetical protein